MNNLVRMISMITVWAAVTLIFIAATVGANLSGFDLVAFTLVVGIAATSATKYIWRGGGEEEHQQRFQRPPMMEMPEMKNKRSARTRLSRLIETMDDDEAADFLADLKGKLAEPGSDGELSALDSLLAERDRKRR
jgi:hypothetical protein